MLARLQELKSLERTRRALRLQILELLDRGATVEDGPLSVRIEDREMRCLTGTKLRDLFGQTWVEATKLQVEPQSYRYRRGFRRLCL